MASGNRITNIETEKFFNDETNGCLPIRFNNKIYKLLRYN